jgi:hypothetical protein
MANPTNPFNWQMPTATDLVTDLPADFETFGQAVATSMADLLGGTTGQVLSKASNTDMDFTWVTSDDANAIQNTIVDAKGDLISATGSDVPARLAVGANGETLVADSSTSTGLKYTAIQNASNPVINSSFDIWQRGTSVALPASTSIANSYTADRFQMPNGANQACTVSRQATGDTTNLPSIQYCGRFQRNSGQTGTSQMNPSYNLETADSIPFAGKQITFSFYARAGANFSQASNALGVIVVTGTGTDQNLQFGYTGQTAVINTSATLTTTWQRFTFTTAAALSNSATQLGFYFPWTPTGTAGAADYFEITGIMINVGTTALPYRRNAGTIQGELSACQRYYFRNTGQQYTPYAIGMSTTATDATLYVQYPVPMRAVPSSVEFANLAISDLFAYSLAVTTLAFDAGSVGTNLARINVGNATGATTFRPAFLRNNNNTAGYLGMSAEL